jgi:hypothetical protein
MARRPNYWKREEILSRDELKALRENLARLSETGIRDFYESAYRSCRIINRDMYPTAKAIQELVQAWKLLWKLRR